MIDERHEELAALHALDLLEGAEKSAFETALARDPALQRLVDELREASAALAHTAPAATPPPALRARLLAEIGTADRPGAVVPGGKVIAFPAWIPWAAAACFAVGAAWTGQLYLTARSESAVLRDQQSLADLALKSAGNQLEAERILSRQQLAGLGTQLADATRQLADTRRQADAAERLVADARTQLADLGRQLKAQGDLAQFKITTLASLLNNSPQALAVAVWNPASQEGVLKVEKLPALAADKDYQLWVVDPQYPAPVDGGVFTVDPQTGEARIQFKAKQQVSVINAFAVTLERKGGVPKAEGPFVLLGK
jgi:anti-sigma-K factor RskA